MYNIPRLILVDDHLLFRESLKSVITSENLGQVIGEASNGKEFIGLLSQLNPDLVIMDIDMPEMNGIEATQLAKELMPRLRFIAYTMYCEEDYYTKMIALGVQGFIVKSSGINILEKGIHEVMAGKTYLCPKFRELVIRSLEAKTAKNAN